MTNIIFMGASQEVTGSQIIIESNNSSIMMDCGMFQGKKDISYIKNKNAINNQYIPDYCILSHAHIDHSGLLPSLVKRGYAGKIYATPATTDLCRFMLKDSVEVFTKEMPIIRKIFKKKGINEKVYPLYDRDDVDHCMNQFFPVKYDTEFKLNPKMSFSFHDSCHILGSASIKLNVTENNVKNRIWYSSDIGHNSQLLCEEPTYPQDIDYLIVETTYGNKKRYVEDVFQKTMAHINDAYKRGGRIVIPAFSVGRMQTLIIIIHKLHLMGLIPDIPIYVDSPLGVNVTKLYEKYEDEIRQDSIKFFKDNGFNPFENSMIKYITEMAESTALAQSDEQCIIISASGMMEGGHVREHAKYVVEDKNSTILFVGYNAEDTLGKRIEYNNGEVSIDGEKYRVRCKVESIGGFSAHADLTYLIDYIENIVSSNALKTIFLIHGEPESSENVKRILNGKGITNVIIPELNKKYPL